MAKKKQNFEEQFNRLEEIVEMLDAGEISIDINCASGEFAANVTVWAPTPHPASKTVLPVG